MKLVAVLDSSVVVAAIGWRGEARQILILLARRSFISLSSPYVLREWVESVRRISTERSWKNPNWVNWLEWLKSKSRHRSDPPAKRIVRDAKDDTILGLGIAERADYLVSYDRDLLDLEKPYGVSCVRPTAFIGAVLARA